MNNLFAWLFSNNKTTREYAFEVANDNSMGEIQQCIREGVWAHLAFSVASFLVIFSFLFFWWTGANLELSEWNSGDKFAALMALIIAGSIALGQYVMYKQGVPLKIIIYSKLGIIALCLIADIGVNIDREDVRVNRISEQSPVLQSMLRSAETPISISGSSSVSPALSAALRDKQDATLWVNGKCSTTHRSSGKARVEKCLTYERARLQSAQSTINDLSTLSESTTTAATQIAMQSRADIYEAAKAKEKDPANHHGLIRFVIHAFNAAPITASILVSMIIMLPLELLFIANGKTLNVNKMALKIATGSEKPQTANDEFIDDLQADPQTANIDDYTEPQTPVKKNMELAPLGDVLSIAGIEILSIMADGGLQKFSKAPVTKKLNELGFGDNNPQRVKIWEFLKDYFAQEAYIYRNPDWKIPPVGEDHKNGSMAEWLVDLAVCQNKGRNVAKKDLRADLQTAAFAT